MVPAGAATAHSGPPRRHAFHQATRSRGDLARPALLRSSAGTTPRTPWGQRAIRNSVFTATEPSTGKKTRLLQAREFTDRAEAGGGLRHRRAASSCRHRDSSTRESYAGPRQPAATRALSAGASSRRSHRKDDLWGQAHVRAASRGRAGAHEPAFTVTHAEWCHVHRLQGPACLQR